MFLDDGVLDDGNEPRRERSMSSAGISYTPKGLYIGGEWTPGAAGKSLVSINPSNGERLAEVPWAGEE